MRILGLFILSALAAGCGSGISDEFPDDLLFAVGSGGTILRSSDGGETWTQVQNVPTNEHLVSIAFHEREGWAVGHDRTILRTADAGESWDELMHTETTDAFLDVAVSSSGTVLVVGQNGNFTRSTDGENFSQLEALAGGLEQNTVAFASGSVAFATGTPMGIDLLKSTNSGKDWVSQAGEGAAFPFASGILGFDFVSSSEGWAVGDLGRVAVFDGSSWMSQTSGTPQALRNVDFVDSTHGWAVGDNAVTIRTEDGGTNWVVLVPNVLTNETLHSVVFKDRDTGWACGASGAFIKTLNGGANWSLMETGFSGTCFGLYLHTGRAQLGL